ncbi:hypothetical protein CVS54_00042 [Microbacterium oxydans]|uniref:N-acetyltransferase domain-containing protein n=1 Tax=Microbacterium oxydans TaxID=82380 RepID=A0A3Q9J2N9_9MICO|nr:hypothetical protein CVS54_00042 [Microbacterium oxydans]
MRSCGASHESRGTPSATRRSCSPDPTIVLQDDTFVEERVRGRGIGRALKVANLRLLMTLPESSASRFLQTYTAPTNAPMLALNRSVGFTEVDVLTVLEGPLG